MQDKLKGKVAGFLVLVFLFSTCAGALSSSLTDPLDTEKKQGTVMDTLLAVAGIACVAYGLQARTETSQWDFLIERYVQGSGEAIDETYPDPDPYTIEYTYVESGTEEGVYYEYTYNHHKVKEKVASIPLVLVGLALFINSWETQEEDFFPEEEGGFFYSAGIGSVRAGYRSNF